MGSLAQNKSLEIGAAVGAVGLLFTITSWVYGFADAPTWMAWWGSAVTAVPGEGDYNLLLMIVGPALLVGGGWYAGEQVILRRRFERLISTDKRSEFVAVRRELEDLSRRLPDGYRGRVKAKEDEIRQQKRAA